MSLKDMSRTGRDLFWSRRGIEECGGGFLGLFLSKLIAKSERKLSREKRHNEQKDDFFDKILKLFD